LLGRGDIAIRGKAKKETRAVPYLVWEEEDLNQKREKRGVETALRRIKTLQPTGEGYAEKETREGET